MLSVVGGTLVLGKCFQLLCHSDSGTLPIVYDLYLPGRERERRVVSKPGERAIFNSSAIYKNSDLNYILCHASNNQNKPPMTGSGQQLLRSINIIGVLDAGIMRMHSNKLRITWSNIHIFYAEPVSKPVLTVQPSIGDISEGQEVTFICSVQRGTLPISFTWYHTERGGALTSQTSKNLEDSYVIRNVRGEHRGEYYCVTSNPANETKQSHAVRIEGVFYLQFKFV